VVLTPPKSHEPLVLCILGQKGYIVLREFLNSKYVNIKCVALESDGANDPYYQKSLNLLTLANVPLVSRTNILSKLSSDTICIAVGWRWLISHNYARLIVIHDSLLPKYRGFNPLVTALIQGDALIGATAIYGAKDCDQGPIITQFSRAINYPIKIQEAIDIICETYKDIASHLLSSLEKGLLPLSAPQDEDEATFSIWRDESDYFLDWSLSSDRLKRQIDASGFPYSGSKSYLSGRLLTIADARVEQDVSIVNRAPGKILRIVEGSPLVICGNGILRIDKAYYADNQQSALPLRSLRQRFSSVGPVEIS